jgi:hypothetical protein
MKMFLDKDKLSLLFRLFSMLDQLTYTVLEALDHVCTLLFSPLVRPFAGKTESMRHGWQEKVAISSISVLSRDIVCFARMERSLVFQSQYPSQQI